MNSNNIDEEKVTKTCTGINCPEHFSLCCGAICTNGKEGEERFVCIACRGLYTGGKCTAGVPSQEIDTSNQIREWEEEYWQKFNNRIGSCFECCEAEDLLNDIKAFITSVTHQAYLKGRYDEIKNCTGCEEAFTAGFDEAHDKAYLKGREEVREEIKGTIKKMWNYPCDCARKKTTCKHDYNLMFSIISEIEKTI